MRKLTALALLAALTLSPVALPAYAAEPAPAVQAAAARDLAPTGRLRVAINLGNGVLAVQDAKTGELGGVSVMIAKTIGERLHLPVDFITFKAAGQVFDALDQGKWDLAFLAIEPERAVKIDFTAPYVFIDGTYLVRKEAPYQKVADLDRDGAKISVGKGAAYDLYLTRNLKHAQLERVGSSPEAIALFKSSQIDAVAGVRQALVDASRGQPQYRVIADRYTRIDQAVALPKGRPAASAYVHGLLEELKATGKVRAALDAAGQDGAIVAPAAP